MGKASRDKGRRHELSVVKTFQNAGFAAERVPLSGAAGGSYTGDVSTAWLGSDKVLECKKRATGFRQIYDWLSEHDALVIGADRRKDLICLPLDDFLTILNTAEVRK